MTTEKTKSELQKVQIRWLIRRDMANVLAIENNSFEHPWSEEDFLTCLRQRNCIGMVAEHDQQIVGFMIYELHKTNLRVLNFAVDQDNRRNRVGYQMVQRLIDKLSQQRRKEIVLETRESNLEAQLFFQKQGFRAVSVMRNHYEDTEEDAYILKYNLFNHESWILPFSSESRISEVDIDADAA